MTRDDFTGNPPRAAARTEDSIPTNDIRSDRIMRADDDCA
jgi:hypothetical protein